MTRKHLQSAPLAALLLLSSVGCDQKAAATPENYLKAINAYYAERSECLLPDTRFPFETSDPTDIKRMETLVAAQLLTVSRETAIKVSRYVPTDLGAKYAPHFCYGHRVATAVESFTPPTVANGFKETRIAYRYQIADTPIWAKSAAVKAAFPDLAHNTSGTATGTTTLAQTGVAWHVPD